MVVALARAPSIVAAGCEDCASLMTSAPADAIKL
jgi:hypothetical protein